MTPERWQRINDVFGRAVALTEDERETFVKESCGKDASLYHEVMALLLKDDEVSRSLHAGAHTLGDGMSLEKSARRFVAVIPRLGDRFTIRREIGTGGMGTVYEAFDESREEVVAVKTLGGVEAENIANLKREFRAIADIAHPNLIRLHELYSQDGVWFFSMERINGVPFVDYVREDEELDERKLRSALRQLCEGVAAIHAAGKLHRDLKPSNVLISNEGRVTILDFGLARNVERDVDASIEVGGGTPGYMAPEQLGEEGATQSSDWYAVGGILYECLTGKRPFAGSAAEIMVAKLNGATPAEAPELQTAPADLVDLALALLQNESTKRPTGNDVLTALGESVASDSVVVVGSQAEAEYGPLFVGREAELQTLRDAFTKVKLGEPVIVYVAGASGIGKSALCDHFLTSISNDARVLRGRCYERENVPFKALDAVVDAIARHLTRLDRVAAASLTPRYAGELCRVFPMLGNLPSFAAEPVAKVDPQELRRRAFLALKELLARMAAREPIVIYIDDLQWSDADSWVLLAQLTTPPDPPPILWVGSHRSEDTAAVVKLRNAISVDLHPLDAESSRALALALTGTDDAADQIITEASGSPFFIRELSHRAKLPRGSGVTIAELVSARVAQLPDDAQRLLQIVAYVGRPVPLAVTLEAAGLSRAEDSAVPVLRTNDLIRTNAANIESYHDKIRETVAASLSDATRVKYSHAFAEALERSGADEPELLALHFRHGGDPVRALQYFKKAAVAAAHALAFDRAALHYKAALELVAPDAREERRELARGLGDALSNDGRGAEAADAYLMAAANSPPSEAYISEADAMRGLMNTGHLDRGFELARRVVRNVGGWFPRSQIFALIVALLQLAWLWITARKYPTVQRHNEALKRKVFVERAVYEGLVLNDVTYAFYFGTNVARRAWRLGDPEEVQWGCGLLIFAPSALLGRFPKRSEMWLEFAHRAANEQGSARAIGLVPMAEAGGRSNCGDWRRTRALCAQAVELGRHGEDPVFLRTVNDYLGTMALFYLGEFAELSTRCPTLADEAKLKGNRLAFNAQSTGFATYAWLAKGDPDGAERSLAAAEAQWPKEGFMLSQYWFLMSRGVIALYRGDAMSGYAYIMARWAALKRARMLARKSTKYQVYHLRAALALASIPTLEERTTRGEMLATAKKHGKALMKLPLAGSKPLGELVLAGVAATTGDAATARARLERAIPGFEDAAMMGFAAAARYRLGNLSGDGELVKRGRDWLLAAGVVDVARFLDTLAPGFAKAS